MKGTEKLCAILDGCTFSQREKLFIEKYSRRFIMFFLILNKKTENETRTGLVEGYDE
jgi:hypothetical protein